MAAGLNPGAISSQRRPGPCIGDEVQPSAHASIRRHLLVTVSLAIVLVLGVGGWASVTQISSAVITLSLIHI